MRNSDTKQQFLLFICAISLVWSGVLTYRMGQLTDAPSNDTPSGDTLITNTDITSNISKLVDEVSNKVVSVVNVDGNSSGSGVIYKRDDKGFYVVTNHHVIDKGTKLQVLLSNGDALNATLIGSDVFSDLALLHIGKTIDIEPIVVGDSDKSKVGEFVIAVGSPMGVEFANSVTFGILSGKNRRIPIDTTGNGAYDWDMILHQTDAAINPGNSGGALINMAGELIGINSMKFSSETVEGMGFSIPTKEMLPIIEQIEKEGKVIYPTVGISSLTISEMSPYQRAFYKIPDNMNEGILVVEVVDKGAAEKAGIQAGDIITAYNEKKVVGFSEFRRQLYDSEIGEVVTFTLVRSDKEMSVEVTLE